MAKHRLKLLRILSTRVFFAACFLTPLLGVTLYQIFAESLTDAFVDSSRNNLFQYAQLIEVQAQYNYSEGEIQRFIEVLLLNADMVDIHLEQPATNVVIQAEFSNGLSLSSPSDEDLFQNGDLYFVQTVPITLNGESSFVKAVFSEQNLRDQLFKVTIFGSCSVIFFTALLLLFSFGQFRRISQVANKLKLSSEQIAKGIEGAQLRVDSDIEEFYGLSKSLDQMHQELGQKQEALEKMIIKDPLAKIGNRLYFTQQLELAYKGLQSKKESFAVVLMDIDSFKQVNDSYGHPMGDRLICFCARVLEHLAISVSGTAVRIGGDEFAIIFRCDSTTKFTEVTDALITKLNRPVYLFDRKINLTVCLGGVVVDSLDIAQNMIVKRADVALYAAKRNKEIPVRLFDTQLFQAETRHDQILSALKNEDYLAEDSGFSFRFQPKFDLVTMKAIGFEALVYWDHPTLGYLSPDKFIPLAEEQGLIEALTRYITKQCSKMISGWNAQSKSNVPVAINVSPLDFKNPLLASELFDCFTSAGVPLNTIEIEVTEQTLADNYEIVADMLVEMSNAGLAIAIDDFGIGYSNLSNLSKFPVNTIKIDRLFVKDCLEDKGLYIIVSAIVNLANELGMNCIAEGIENDETRQLLIELGCKYGQGEGLYSYLSESNLVSFWQSHGQSQLEIEQDKRLSVI